MYERSVEAADAVGFRRYQFASRIKLGDLLKVKDKLNLACAYYAEALARAEAEGVQREVDEARRKLEGIRECP